MRKMGTSLNSSALKSDLAVIPKHHQTHPRFKALHFQTTYMNSKRKHSKHRNMYGKMYSDNNNYLHLNSLWSIWYGVLLTLFQGYLAIHGASRFLGCSLISWKIEPVAELNLQIVLSGLVFVLLPFFFTSAVFKVGNMANDGIKLASTSKDRICSKIAQDSFAEEAHTSSLKTLWAHGGPTAAFIHILIALCLLLPRLLLEGRIIENGFLPRDTIWRTELDFIVVNRNNLFLMSMKTSQYQNNTLVDLLESGNDLNITEVISQTNVDKNSKNFLLSNIRQEKNGILVGNGTTKYIEFSDFGAASLYGSNTFHFSEKSTVFPIVTSNFTIELKDDISTTNRHVKNASTYEDIESVTIANRAVSNLTDKFRKTSKSDNKAISYPRHLVSYNTYHHKQPSGPNNHKSKVIRKYKRQRNFLYPYEKNGELKNQKNRNSGFIDMGTLKNINLFNQSHNENKANKLFNYGQTWTSYLKFSTTTFATLTDSDIHIVKPEKLPKIVPSDPVSSNSKVIEIKQRIKRMISSKENNIVKIEPELFLNDTNEDVAEIDSIESYTTSTVQSTISDYNEAHLDGFAGMLQVLFGVKKSIDIETFNNPPSAEFLNLLFALLVWCVRYPAVFWTTGKSFASIFSIQMIASAADIIFSYAGISSLFKLQIYNQRLPIQNQGLVLNANATLALFLLSVVLILSSSMVLYLFGHDRLSAKMRDRSIITLSSNKSWICFAHCSSLCYILCLCAVKAPLLNDLSTIYRISLHCPTFAAVFVSVIHIFVWVLIWITLTVKNKWSFKLPPLDSHPIIGKAITKPLLTQNRGSLTINTAVILNNSTNLPNGTSAAAKNEEMQLKCEPTGDFPSMTSNLDVLNDASNNEIYWPKTNSSSPQLKVTFQEVTSIAEDAQQHVFFDEHEPNNGKSQTKLYRSSIEGGKIDDGEYATLRPVTVNTLGNASGSSCETKNNSRFYKNYAHNNTQNFVDLNEYNVLRSPSHPNFLDDCIVKVLGDDNISEEGKLIERVLDGSVTYASTKNLEPPLPSPLASNKTKSNSRFLASEEKCNQMTEGSPHCQSPEYLIIPVGPAKVVLHKNETHTIQNATPRCLRSTDSGVSHEALTPRSDTNSFGTVCTISPPEMAPSESSSGIHSAEERDIEVIIRPHVTYRNISKFPPSTIQEETNNRCTNMRMSSFCAEGSLNSATLPLQRSNADERVDYSQHCSTMPLTTISYKQNDKQIKNTIYATSAQCMSKTQSTFSKVSSFKAPLYANSGLAMSGHKQRLYDPNLHARTIISPHPQINHTILSNGVRYSNPNILRRNSVFKSAGAQNSLTNSTIHEDRDSANYSMVSDQESIYVTANSLY